MKLRKTYYSILIKDHYVNKRADISVSEHDNNIQIDDNFIDSHPNYFKTKAEAEKAASKIWKVFCKEGVAC